VKCITGRKLSNSLNEGRTVTDLPCSQETKIELKVMKPFDLYLPMKTTFWHL